MNEALANVCGLSRMPEDSQPFINLAERDAETIGSTDCFTHIFVIPFIEYHAAFLFVCSLRRHHIWVMAMKVGAVAETL